MLFGTSTFSGQAFSAIPDDVGSVIVTSTGNNLVLTIGPVSIAANSITETSGSDPLYLGTGTITISSTANVPLNGSPLIMATGNVSVSATAVINASGNQLTIDSGTVTISGTASVTVNGNELTLSSNGGGGTNVIVWNEIIPGASMVWTPIVPY
jgi:hypothetical protein